MNFGAGLLVGYFIGNKSGFVNATIIAYLTSVLICRSAISLAVNSIGVNGNLIGFLPDVLKEEGQFLSNPNMSFDYNWWSNTIIVKRNMTSKIVHDGDKITFAIRKIFNALLCWDVFFHYRPLKIIMQ